MKRFAAILVASSCLAATTALGAELTAPLPHTRADWANAENDLGETAPDLKLTNLTVVLERPPERQHAFETLLREQQDPASPNFHRWLTPEQVGQRFGPADQDIAAVSSWLESQGLHVDGVANSRVRIEFSGPAALVSAAFGANLHAYLVEGETRIAPANPPRVPTSLSGVVRAVAGLQTVRERSFHRAETAESQVGPKATFCTSGTCSHFLWPADFAVIYDIIPVLQQGILGAGQTIAIIGRARVYMPDIENFQTASGLPTKDPIVVVPPNGIDPGPAASSGGTTPKDQSEATIDVTRAGSVAPGATIQLVISANSATTSGLLIAGEYVIDSAPVQIINLSFGSCEQSAGQSTTMLVDSLFSQAAAEGISVFVSSGDSGAAECEPHGQAPPANQILSPNYLCSSSYVTCVGGTEFADSVNPAAYWSTSNTSGRESAFGYIPEGAWNEPLDKSGNIQVFASGGGVSSFIARPPWQPASTASMGRFTPDVAFSAAAHDGYFMCLAASGRSCVPDSTGAFGFVSESGTSAAAPDMAGIAALLNQKMGGAQGNLNPRLYALAANPGNGVFHDITVATSGVSNCDVSVPSMCNNSTPGPAALAGGLAGYAVGPGYDLVTGLGSIDVANLLANWAAPLPGQLQMPAPLVFADQLVGTQSATQTVTITNIGSSSVTVSSVTGTDLADFPATTNCVTTLQPGGQCTVTVSFSPSTAGTHSQTVTVTSSGAGSPQSFTMSGNGTTPTTNYQGLWWESPAGSAPGWGINFAHQGDIIFATWYTYDLGGAGNWLSMTATKIASGTYGGPLYETSGPPFNSVPFSPSQVVATAVGNGRLTFSDASNGAFTYSIGSVTQTKAITREVFGTVPTCATSPSLASLAAATNYTDLWWADPAGSESGWGVNLTHQDSALFATWFTYDSTGKAMWLAVNSFSVGTNVYSGTVYQTTGTPFNSNPHSVTVTPVGSGSFTFTDGNHASFAYTVNGISQVKSITRELFSPTGTVCH